MHPMRFFLFFAVLLLLVVLVGPLVIPIPPLLDTVDVRQLADADSQWLSVEGIDVHYKIKGAGKPVIILLHGFGSSTSSWQDVMVPLAEFGTVIAYDRPAFGLTERPLPGEWSGESPYSDPFQVKMLIGLMDGLGIDEAVLIGHSAGGSIAMQAAIESPERIQKLVLVDAAVMAGGGIPGWMRPLVNTPHLKRLGPFFSRSLAGKEGEVFLEASWYDFSKFTEEDKAAYRKPLQAENWDFALWEYTKANRDTDLDSKLSEIEQPVLVVSGENDRILPVEMSQELAASLPNATFTSFSSCGHIPQEECPVDFLVPVAAFLKQ